MNISKLLNLPEGAGPARFPPSEIWVLGVGGGTQVRTSGVRGAVWSPRPLLGIGWVTGSGVQLLATPGREMMFSPAKTGISEPLLCGAALSSCLHREGRRQWQPTLVLLPGKIPWMEELGRLQSMGSRRFGHDWATSLSLFTFMRWRRKWQPTLVFLPGESQGWRGLVGFRLWGRTELDTTEAT